MSNTVIDSKTDKRKFGFWPVTETVTTTLTLVNLGAGRVGINYHSKFSGVKDGEVSGGPIEVSGDIEKVVNQSPKVTVIVSQFNKTSNYISMHVKIVVDIPVIGSETIYSKTLGGDLGAETGFAVALDGVKKLLEAQQKRGAHV